MKRLFALGCAALALAACQQDASVKANNAEAAEANAATAAAPSGTLEEAIAGNGKFREAVRAAGLQATLGGPGPYTVLAPADAAFAKLPAGSMEALSKPEAKGDLTTVVTYHVLPGTILVADLNRAIDNGGGKAVLATMAGKTVTATRSGQSLILTDQAGNRATISGTEKVAKNGVVHQVDTVLLPEKPS